MINTMCVSVSHRSVCRLAQQCLGCRGRAEPDAQSLHGRGRIQDPLRKKTNVSFCLPVQLAGTEESDRREESH